MGGGASKLVGLLLLTVVALIGASIIEGPLSTASTESKTVTVGANATAALQPPSWYRTATANSGAPRGVSITGLKAATTFTGVSADGRTATFSDAQEAGTTITYLGQMDDATVVIILKIIPLFMVLAAVGASVGGAYLGVTGGTRGDGVMTTVISVITGAVLVPVILSFVATANETYTLAPEFVGITSVTTLVTIGFVLAILGSVVGAVAPGLRSMRGAGGM